MKEYQLNVTGYNYNQEALASLMSEKNYIYSLPKSELLDEVDLAEDERVYEYEIEECALQILHEPTNQYDPAALRVYADGVPIGYVPRGHVDVLKQISVQPGLNMSVRIYGGKYKQIIYNQDDDFYGSMEPKYFTIQTGKAPYRAVMIFQWNSTQSVTGVETGGVKVANYGQDREVNATPEEATIFNIIQGIVSDAALRLTRKSDDYVTAVSGEWDLARFKFTPRAKWIVLPVIERGAVKHRIETVDDVYSYAEYLQKSMEHIRKYSV